MTTKEISQQIVSSIFAEIPIEIDNAQDKADIEEYMEAIVYDGVERFRKSMLEKFRSQLEVIDNAIKFSRQNENIVDGIEIETCMIMLNEND